MDLDAPVVDDSLDEDLMKPQAHDPCDRKGFNHALKTMAQWLYDEPCGSSLQDLMNTHPEIMESLRRHRHGPAISTYSDAWQYIDTVRDDITRRAWENGRKDTLRFYHISPAAFEAGTVLLPPKVRGVEARFYDCQGEWVYLHLSPRPHGTIFPYAYFREDWQVYEVHPLGRMEVCGVYEDIRASAAVVLRHVGTSRGVVNEGLTDPDAINDAAVRGMDALHLRTLYPKCAGIFHEASGTPAPAVER
jgi:hypothetical protein